MQPTSPPLSRAARAHDLTDAEFAELDALLLEVPEPLEPLDAVMLDGYLCGVIVQPVLLEPATWLGHVFDLDGRPLPEDTPAAWRQRSSALIMRRYGVLNRAIVEDQWFDPLVLEFGAQTPVEDGPQGEPEALRGLSEVSRSLAPWVAGFQHATVCFPDLAEMPEATVASGLARLFRHLPAESDEDRTLIASLDREFPLHTLEEAIEELVATVTDLQELTHKQRYKVEAFKRETAKVGRNDACPCGSAKKFKLCHGKP